MAHNDKKFITYRRLVDLSHPISPDTPVWPGDPAVDFQTVSDLAGQDYFLRRFSMGEHSGTHLASPSAYYADGTDPDGISVESLVAPAAVVHAQGPASLDPDYTLSAGDIADWERTNGPIEPNTLVLLNTGWSRFWSRPARFINTGDDGAMHTPGFSLEAARFLLEWRGVAGLGIDTHGIDAGADTGFSVSRLVLARPALVLECLNNLNQLPPTGATAAVGRLRLVGGSGSPASVLAFAP